MRQDALPFFCFAAGIAAAVLLSGCMTRTVEIRPVAPVVESNAVPGAARGATAATLAPQFSGASGAARQESASGAAEPATPPGVQVEAVIPGMYSGRSLSFERDEAPK